MLVLSRRFYLPVILIAVLGLPIGCSSNIVVGDPESGGGETPEPGTSEPPDPGIEDPSDDRPPEPTEPNDDALPDFSVADVNPGSARYGEAVSPRDYLGQISAWYFGSSS